MWKQPDLCSHVKSQLITPLGCSNALSPVTVTPLGALTSMVTRSPFVLLYEELLLCLSLLIFSLLLLIFFNLSNLASHSD